MLAQRFMILGALSLLMASNSLAMFCGLELTGGRSVRPPPEIRMGI